MHLYLHFTHLGQILFNPKEGFLTKQGMWEKKNNDDDE